MKNEISDSLKAIEEKLINKEGLDKSELIKLLTLKLMTTQNEK